MKFGTKIYSKVENSSSSGAVRKLISELFKGDFRFLSICLLVKMKMSNFSALSS